MNILAVKTLGVLSSSDQHSSNIHQTFPSLMDDSKFPSEIFVKGGNFSSQGAPGTTEPEP